MTLFYERRVKENSCETVQICKTNKSLSVIAYEMTIVMTSCAKWTEVRLEVQCCSVSACE